MAESSYALEEMNTALPLQSMNVDMAEYLRAANARLGAPPVLAVPAPPPRVNKPPSDFAAALAAYGQVTHTVTYTLLHSIRLLRAVSLTL